MSGWDADAALVAQACRVLGRLDATHGAFGHVSARLGEGRMLIRGKGPGETNVRDTAESDIIVVDANAEKVAGPDRLRAPSESFIHTHLFRRRPDVNCVIHAHPESAVLLTVCRKEIMPIYGAYGFGSKVASEGVPVYESSVTVSTEMRGKAFSEFFGDCKACLMRGHGVTVVGASVQEAVVRTLLLKEVTDFTVKALMIGQPYRLPDEEIAEFGPEVDAGRERGTAGGVEGTMSRWRNYLHLVGETEVKGQAGAAAPRT